MSNHRIMIIDDEKIVGDMAKLSLEQEGYAVETFLDAGPALKRLKEKKFDVVVADYQMEGIGGMEVLQAVKSLHPATRVIMLSAFAGVDTALEAIRRDVHDFFHMPVKIKELKASIRRAMEVAA